ncbi:MAG: DUF5985 family protein [Sulfurifustis sp.]
MASLIVALFFFRFWRNSRDRLFLFFALSFALEGVNRVALGLTGGLPEDRPSYYIVRLIAYSLILIAILDKNRPRRGS